jgi:signal transduction histidine kinase
MAGGVAHDFNNILTAVLGRAQLALEDTQNEKVKRNLKVIEEAATEGAYTVRRLQDFTRVRRDRNFRAVNINDVIEDTLKFMEPRIVEYQSGTTAHLNLQTTLRQVSPVAGNEGELKEVLTNIIANALDAMPLTVAPLQLRLIRKMSR